jgi:adenylate kinase family enzyme
VNVLHLLHVVGGPGSGKGTQCARIKENFNYAHISTGDLFRNEVSKGGKDAEALEAIMKEGKMIPMVCYSRSFMLSMYINYLHNRKLLYDC